VYNQCSSKNKGEINIMENEEKMIDAGSREDIFYNFFKFVDSVIHGLNLDNNIIAYNFCQWAHRKD
jgi:hypothetical protein